MTFFEALREREFWFGALRLRLRDSEVCCEGGVRECGFQWEIENKLQELCLLRRTLNFNIFQLTPLFF